MLCADNYMSAFEFDEIGYWSEVKLDIIKDYAKEYSKILANQKWCKGHYYVDAFAGAGIHISKATGELVAGSPLNALNTTPPFDGYHLIDLDSGKAENLRKIAEDIPNVKIYQDDCNKVLLEEVFPLLSPDRHTRGLCLLDPYGLHLNWASIQKAGQLGTVEIFLNFPVADINRNALWHNRDKVKPDQVERMTAFWGDASWLDIAYDNKGDLFGYPTKNNNETIAEAFRQRLKDIAGFEHVPKPIPMRNSNNAIVYYLYFASPNATGHKIVQHIFNKYRNQGVT
ncbi:MAG: three-Cys-motif partner protein TcmP [Methylacidiphilales bacterium]|nr:three-Cys-motif partner protein TcmP [Candidatus Methylacidiphilales bacterium]